MVTIEKDMPAEFLETSNQTGFDEVDWTSIDAKFRLAAAEWTTHDGDGFRIGEELAGEGSHGQGTGSVRDKGRARPALVATRWAQDPYGRGGTCRAHVGGSPGVDSTAARRQPNMLDRRAVL